MSMAVSTTLQVLTVKVVDVDGGIVGYAVGIKINITFKINVGCVEVGIAIVCAYKHKYCLY
jgi:hypothetical protein